MIHSTGPSQGGGWGALAPPPIFGRSAQTMTEAAFSQSAEAEQ